MYIDRRRKMQIVRAFIAAKQKYKLGVVGLFLWLALGSASSVPANAASTSASASASKASSKPASKLATSAKLGQPCKTPGQVAGTAPNQLVCQTGYKKRLLWARNSGTPTSIASAPSSAADSAVASFRSSPSPSSAGAALALLNAEGASGYAYVGPFFVGGANHEIFVKAERNVTYLYETVEMPTAVEGVAVLLRKQGSAGFVYKGPALFGASLEKTLLLFVKSSAKTTTYSYRTTPWPSEESVMLNELNTNGADGYRYLGDLVPDPAELTVGLRVFVKDDQSSINLSYSLKPQITDRAKFLTEATAMGNDGAVWKGGYVVGAGTLPIQLRSLYETSSLQVKPVTYVFRSPVPSSIEALVATANENAKKGNLLWGQYILGTETVSVYSNARLSTLPLVGVVLP
jgi:hypothetical protein